MEIETSCCMVLRMVVYCLAVRCQVRDCAQRANCVMNKTRDTFVHLLCTPRILRVRGSCRLFSTSTRRLFTEACRPIGPMQEELRKIAAAFHSRCFQDDKHLFSKKYIGNKFKRQLQNPSRTVSKHQPFAAENHKDQETNNNRRKFK